MDELSIVRDHAINEYENLVSKGTASKKIFSLGNDSGVIAACDTIVAEVEKMIHTNYSRDISGLRVRYIPGMTDMHVFNLKRGVTNDDMDQIFSTPHLDGLCGVTYPVHTLRCLVPLDDSRAITTCFPNNGMSVTASLGDVLWWDYNSDVHFTQASASIDRKCSYRSTLRLQFLLYPDSPTNELVARFNSVVCSISNTVQSRLMDTYNHNCQFKRVCDFLNLKEMGLTVTKQFVSRSKR
jgi:hypothetical protein